MRHTNKVGEARADFATFDNAFAGIAHVALNGAWLRVNRTFRQMLGYSSEELDALTVQAITHADDVTPSRNFLRRLVKGEIPHYRMQKRYLRKDGKVVWVDLQVAPQFDASREIEYFVATAIDITEQKRMETHLRRSAADTENILHLIAHEFRNVLNTVEMNLQLAQMQPDPDSLARSLSGVRRQMATTADLLTHLEMLGGGTDTALTDSVFPLADAVSQAVERLRSQLRDTGTSVVIARKLPQARGNAAAAVHVLVNLLENAIKYRREDVDCRIRIDCIERADRITLTVRDNGLGVPQADRERIFQPSVRGSNVGGRRGRGLGLALCRKLMESMGGAIRLAPSSKEGGTAFSVTFRAARPHQPLSVGERRRESRAPGERLPGEDSRLI